jgi:ribosome recycling factor
MAYDFSELKQHIQDTKEWLKGEYLGIRTGRAAPALLDSVKVDMYGSKMPINQVGNVTVEDARTLRVIPWDQSQIKTVESAIASADLGVSASADERGVRVNFPELTAERRQQLQKLVNDRLEQARISVRNARDEVRSDIQKQEKNGDLTEDEKYRHLDELQKLVDDANTELEDMAQRKHADIEG